MTDTTPKAKPTRYVVLVKTEQATWMKVGEYAAANATAAIRKHVEESNSSGEYVAVPARQFQPKTVKIETVPKISFDDEASAPKPAPAPKTVTP